MKKSFDMGIKETAKSYKKYLDKKRKTVDISKIDDDKIAEIYEQYAPKNISLQEFKKRIKEDPDLLNAEEFSTFNPELAELRKKVLDGKLAKDDFRHKLKSSISQESMKSVAQNYAKIYENIIDSDEELLKDALTFSYLTPKQKQIVANKIVSKLNKHFRIKDDVKVIFKDPDPKELKNEYDTNSVVAGICDGRNIIIYNGNYGSDFLGFIDTFSHEYAHFIDHKRPNFGMLGAQLAGYGFDCYVSSHVDKKEYHKNPTEISSFYIGEFVQKHAFDVFVKHVPDLERFKLQLSALKVQKQEALSEVTKVKQDVLKEQGIEDLPARKKTAFFKKLEKQDPEFQKVLQDYKQLCEEHLLMEKVVDKLEDLRYLYEDQYEKKQEQKQAPTYKPKPKDMTKVKSLLDNSFRR